MDAKTNLKKRLPSRHVTEGPERAPHRSYLYAMGLTTEQIYQPFVGVASCWNEAAPCNISLMRQAQAVKKGVASAGGTPREFCTITVTDGIAMGHDGMRSSLPSRECIADSVELTVRGHAYQRPSLRMPGRRRRARAPRRKLSPTGATGTSNFPQVHFDMPPRSTRLVRLEVFVSRMRADTLAVIAGGLTGSLVVAGRRSRGKRAAGYRPGCSLLLEAPAGGPVRCVLEPRIPAPHGRAAQSPTRAVKFISSDPGVRLEAPNVPELRELVSAVDNLRLKLALAPPPKVAGIPLTGSGMFEPLNVRVDPGFDPTSSGSFATVDMVNRLHPKSFRWLESSHAEQLFLGWSLDELRKKSFIDIVHSDDRNRAWEQLQAARIKGEAHGLIYRIKTARGEKKAIEVNIGVRYGADMNVTTCAVI